MKKINISRIDVDVVRTHKLSIIKDGKPWVQNQLDGKIEYEQSIVDKVNALDDFLETVNSIISNEIDKS